MSSTPSPFTDEVSPILRGEPTIDDNQRADLFDIFHNSKDPAELVEHLAPLAVPDDLKTQLLDKKKKLVPPVMPIDKVTDVINRMKAIDPAALETAEAHPNVLKALTTAATTPDKTAPVAAGGASAPAGGKPASGASKAPADPTAAFPARPDGLTHLPPIPAGHKRILASDSGIHDIPEDNIQKAFEIDPRLHVLNP